MEKYKNGIHMTDLANMHSISKCTISTILWIQDFCKGATIAKDVTRISE